MKQKQRFFLLLGGSILSILVLTIGFVTQRAHHGFNVQKIRSPFEASSEWEIPRLKEVEKELLQEIVSQDFHYLGSGAQCYAFLSNDGKYVIKFFKIKHLIPKKWLNLIPFPALANYRLKKIDRRILRHHELFTSYRRAYEELKEETGLIHIHLNKSKELDIRMRLYNRQGNCYHLNLDDYEYVLQKKSELVKERITSLIEKGETKEALESISTLLKQILVQCKKGFIDQDSGVSHNYGFVGDQVIHFDIGEMIEDGIAKEPFYYQREILRVGRKLEEWIKVQYPDLLHDVEELIDGIINSSDLFPIPLNNRDNSA